MNFSRPGTPVLVLETATDTPSVILYTRSDRALVRTLPPRSADMLLGAVEGLLNEADIRWGDIQTLAVSVGPGSYTGVRLGVAAAQAWSISCECKVIPISSLAWLACGVEAHPRVTALVDARRSRLCWQHFDCSGGSPEPLGSVCIGATFSADADWCEQGYRIIGDVSSIDRADLPGCTPVEFELNPKSLWNLITRSTPTPLELLQPTYAHGADSWKRRQS